VVFDTPAGTVKARVKRDSAGPRVAGVTFSSVPSFVLQGGIEVALGARRVRVDVAFGGVFYAIVDGEATGLPLDSAHLPELRRAGLALREAVESKVVVEHPLDSRLKGLSGTVFTGPATMESADLRTVAIIGRMSVDRSPGGTATAALLAVIDEMGLLSEDRPFVQESLLGTTFVGRVVGRTSIGEQPAVVPEIEGSAWITGEHTFYMDERDPFREGFQL
jgi:proline racemase